MLQSLRHGFATMIDRPGLAGIVYGVNLVVGLIVSVPLAVALTSAVGSTGFGPDLVGEFDLALWADIVEDSGAALLTFVVLFIWVLPVYLGWKVAMTVGLMHATSRGGGRSFWEGVGRHTGQALLLAGLFLACALVVVVLSVVLALIVSVVVGGQPGAFWGWWITLPALLAIGLAKLDMMHDFARTELVIAGTPVVKSWLRGLMWPKNHPGAIGVYFAWLAAAVFILYIAFPLDLNISGMWIAFMIQQILMMARSAVTVGWIASEVHLFERVEARRTPVIADDVPA